jgi:hypothetical protein
MKKLSLFFLLLLLAASCATTGATKKTAIKTATGVAPCPVFYTGRDLPAAFDVMWYDDPRATQTKQ